MHTRGRVARVACLALGATLVAATALAQDASPSAAPTPFPTVPPETETLSGNWPVPQGDLAATRSAVDSSIDSSTIGDLQLAWTFDVTAPGFFGSITSQPVVVGDTVYIQDMRSNVFALDKATGSVRWEAPFDIGSIGPNGVAVAYDMVFAGLSDTGEVVALDAADGSEVWRQRIGSPPGEGIDMSPIVYDGTVYASTVPGTGLGSFYAGGDRGVLYALDARTGEVEWWFDTTNGGFDAVAVAGGGGLWYPPSFDADGNLYFGVGNPAPWPLTPECPNGECRPGDNLYTSSMVSLDPTTGSVRWHYQDAPHDLLDLDFQATPILATVAIDGTDTPVAIGSGKTGNVVAVRQDTGEVVWKTPVGRHQNDTPNTPLPTDGSTVEVYPGSLGGVETPMAFANGVLFAAYLDLPQYQTMTGQDDAASVGYDQGQGGLVAIDATTGGILWDIHLDTLPVAAATVANDVVFAGGIDGTFAAYSATTGERLWSYDADNGFNAPPAIAGDYLFVAAGFPKLPFSHAPGTSAPPEASADPDVTQAPTPVAKLYAFRIGGPEAQPTAEATAEATSEATAEATSEATAEPTAGPTAEATVEPTAGATQPAAATVELSAKDLFFEPKDITIPANTDVTIEVTNDGGVIHDLVQPDSGADTGEVQPGQTGTAVVNLPPGTYQFWCSVPGHKDAGMTGTITVQ
ncbi:MAG: PQQ-binding-like beta-propeller repeat protein [Chloroflexota bacterium]